MDDRSGMIYPAFWPLPSLHPLIVSHRPYIESEKALTFLLSLVLGVSSLFLCFILGAIHYLLISLTDK